MDRLPESALPCFDLEVLPAPVGQLVTDTPLIRAATDAEAVRSYLRRYLDSPKTLRAVRKELERFLLWVAFAKRTTFAQLTSDDLEDYKLFLTDPQPAHIWVSENKTKWPRQHENWRPFAGPLSNSSQRYAHTILHGFFGFLAESRYLSGNPMALVKPPKKIKTKKITRLLPVEGIQLLYEVVDSDEHGRRRARNRFMLSLFYLTGLRLFEATAVNMGAIVAHDSGRLWLPVIGKGSKEGEVPVLDAVFSDLRAYRVAYGLPPEPQFGEETPLLMTVSGRFNRAADCTVRESLQEIMELAANLASERGNPALAMKLRTASTHWLRHSCFSHLAATGIDLPRIQKLARHENISTTSLYLHAEDTTLHEDMSGALNVPAPTTA